MRLAVLILVALTVTLAATSASSSATAGGPTGLHGFMLRADEPQTDAFHRTPAFAWDPFPGAVGYQFQLSMSSTFRENAVFFNTNTLTTPVAAPSLVLPWITGSPHSLYARVRATLSNGDVTPWSDDYGFDVVPPTTPPTPMLPSEPGLLRWTPVEGATGYQVWLVDVPKKGQPSGLGKETVRTNVLDEREFYTFHQSAQWTGTVRWRVRAERSNEAGGPTNSLPVTTYGPWSSIYSSTNPSVTGGPIAIDHAVSDVVTDSNSSVAHRLMPAFTWHGNQTLSGTNAELFRVYVFTDKFCLNRVYTSAVVGSPAYGPRPGGTLALPSDSAGIASARGSYLDDGAEPSGEMFDGTPVSAQESAPAAVPTTTPPPDLAPATGGGSSTGATPPAAAPAAPAAPPSGSSGGGAVSKGAPVDLWDTDSWPKGGYYWTVVGVAALPASSAASTVAAPGASLGSTLLPVSDVSKFSVGQSITIGIAPDSDTATIGAIGNGLVTLKSPLNFGHAAGQPIASTASSGVAYRDMELAQDVCQFQPQRVGRFGIASEPPLTTAQETFATGLSPTGRLVSAARTATFYGQPLVAWAPSLTADSYQVQWSTKAYPFTPVGSIMTASTATLLPIAVGTWYYRVRGFDYSLPTGSQALSWSDPEQLGVAAPTFKVTKAATKKFKVIGKSK
ncbi:MAG: hypothetical protein QOK22_539 [Gaiellaceae bacterium]|nr:hypothetical protein [Gaiellaceae bacterium]